MDAVVAKGPVDFLTLGGSGSSGLPATHARHPSKELALSNSLIPVFLSRGGYQSDLSIYSIFSLTDHRFSQWS